MKATKVRISLSLSPGLLEEVDGPARAAKLSRSAFIEGVLRQHLLLKKSGTKEAEAGFFV